MKIALDDRIFISQRYGGISRYFYRLAERFCNAGEEVRVLAPFYCNQYLESLPRGVVRGLSVDRWPRPLRNRLMALNGPLSAVQLSSWQPQVLHETYYGMDRPRCRSVARVVTVHDMIHEIYPAEFADGGYIASCKKRAIEEADHVICVSQNTKHDLVRVLGTSESKISVIHHGVDEFVDVGECEIRSERPYLLYVGQRGGYKNFKELLQAVSASARLRADFDIIAFGGGPFKTSELAQITALGFGEGRVRQMGGDDRTLARLYRDAQAFVYPSLYEGFGLPPLEAMARDCAVISSSSSCLPEIIADAARYFDPLCTDNIRDAIEAVVYDDDERLDLIARGRQRLLAFSWNRCAQETLVAYQLAVEQAS